MFLSPILSFDANIRYLTITRRVMTRSPFFYRKKSRSRFFFSKHSWILSFTVCARLFERERERERERGERGKNIACATSARGINFFSIES